ncbi:hypothetical protein [Lysinibacillus sp. NPDC086135]|uniref:hypothetical protein n=1 Tax=Lysinibacillus sp. NPDC086135 TaxID=3364130 RepID=UPI00380190B5
MSDSDKQILLHKELDLIQSCINRMAQNSFTIKGWYFALIIVISAWKFNNPLFYGCTLLVATVIFYVLNLQFYIYERRFREVYSKRLKLRCEDDNYIDELYSLKPGTEHFSCNLFFKKYVLKNKMLVFMYFGICILLVTSNLLMNIEQRGTGTVNLKDDNIEIEIKGLKSLLNSLE